MNQDIGKGVFISNEMKTKIVKKNIVLYVAGQIVSLLGTNIYNFIVSLYILEVTGSALNFALTFALGTLPRIIFGPISGVVADKIDRKKMVVILDILSGIIVLGLLVLSMIDEFRLIYIYMTTVLLSVCNTFFYTALTASIPNFTDDEGIVKANSWGQSSSSITSICGPFLGGLLFSIINIRFFLLINGISFIISGITEIFIDFNIRQKVYGVSEKINENKSEVKNTLLKDLNEGFKYLLNQKWLINLCCFIVFLNSLIIIGLNITVPYIAKQIWGFSSKQFGILNVMYPLGILVGSLSFSVIPAAKNNNKRIVKCILVMSISILLIGVIASEKLCFLNNWQYLIILGVLFFIIAFAETLVNIPITIIIQTMVPNEKLGRVYGIIGTISLGLVPISSIIGGLLIEVITPWILPIICGLIMMFLTVLMSSTEELRKI